VIDGATNATSTVAVGSNPGAICVNPVTNRIYVLNVANQISGNVTVIDGATNATTTIAQGNNAGARGIGAQAIAVNPVTNTIYVNDYLALYPDGGVKVIDGATNGTSVDIRGADAEAIAVNTVANKVYVACVHGPVYVIDGATNYSTTLSAGLSLGGVAVNTVTNKAYVLDSFGNGSVSVIDGATNAVATIGGFSAPTAIAVNPATNKVYVSNGGGNSVTVFDGTTIAMSTVAVGAYPFAMAVNSATNKVYVLSNDANGTVTVIDGTPAMIAPSFISEPQSQTVNAGAPVVFNAPASGSPSPTYQWSFNGTPLTDGSGVSGSATSELYMSAGVTAVNAGSYACAATNSVGAAASTPAALTVSSTSTPGRMVNISTRALVTPGPGGSSLIAGFVVSGPASNNLVLRGVGPMLASFGVPDALPDPGLSLHDASLGNLITQDSGWQTPPSVPIGGWAGKATAVDATPADFAQVGAFGLTPGSADSAVKVQLPAGAYTAQIAPTGNGQGVALAEVYDEDLANPGAQLINISSRAYVGPGSDILIAGFVISGSTSETVLIRASGPALAAFGIFGTLSDPKLQLFDANQNLIASALGWMGNPQLAGAASRVGAFSWGSSPTQDSAILITLPPGSYTVQCSGASSDSGTALIEVYAVQ
jgi:YVTN family beta-propeller protein